MTSMRSEKSVLIRDEYDIVSACSIGQRIVSEIRLSTDAQNQAAVVVSELARNMLLHAGSGVITFRRIDGREGIGVEIIAVDSGPGIQNVEEILQHELETDGAAGTGLLVAKYLMDDFGVNSEVGRGTTVTVRKWLK